MLDDEDPDTCPVCGSERFGCHPPRTGGIVITVPKEEEMTVTLAERTYLNAAGEATLDSEEAVVLVGIQGDTISDEEAERYGVDPASGLPSSEGDPLESMSYRDLQAKAKDLDLSASGSMEELRDRIREHQAASRPQTEQPAPADPLAVGDGSGQPVTIEVADGGPAPSGDDADGDPEE